MSPDNSSKLQYLTGAFIWLAGWLLLFALNTKLDLANLAILLIMISALAATCLPGRVSALLALSAALAFDWFFIPPFFTFKVDVHQHLLMLLVMLVVNLVIILLMTARRRQVQRAARHAHEAELLRTWGDELHQAQEPGELKNRLQQLLAQITGVPVSLLLLKHPAPASTQHPQQTDDVWILGDTNLEQRHALWHCLHNSQQLGRGTGYYELFFDVYLPVRTRGQAIGAVLLHDFAVHDFSTRVHLQTICDQFGNALERRDIQLQEQQVREQVQTQLLRNNLLAAISHDYRTPLATITSAATSLYEQQEKLSTEQSKQLAMRIQDEAERLNKITSNILQLARLDNGGQISCDWQSAEEIIGDLMRRWRLRGLESRLRINLQPELPLLWCDPLLIGQLLENLVDNALKYGPENSWISISCRLQRTQFLLSVTDSGPGIAPELHEAIFQPFQRGIHSVGTGAGVGLALCRAIARAHNGEISVCSPIDGGTCFDIVLPYKVLPPNLLPQENVEEKHP